MLTLRLLAVLLITFPLVLASEEVNFVEYPTYSAHVNNVSIAYQQFGEQNDETILLVMGLGAQLIHWDDDFVLDLVNAGYRVIRFDNRDVGFSQKMYLSDEPGFMTGIRFKLGWSLNAPYKLDDMAADAIGLLDHLKVKKAHVVGASMGGMIAQIMAANYPDRVATLTSIMSTSSAAHLPAGDIEVQPRPKDITREQHIRDATAFWKVMGGQRNNYSDEQWWAVNARGYDRMYYPPGFSRQLWAILDSGDRVDLLKTIQQPTLVIHGSADRLLPLAGGEHTAELVSGSKLVVIDGMGHYIDKQSKPQIVKEILGLIEG